MNKAGTDRTLLIYAGYVGLIVIAVTLIVTTLSSCMPPNEVNRQQGFPVTIEEIGDDPILVNRDVDGVKIWRFLDREANVVCWVAVNSYPEGAGISCLPLQETALRIAVFSDGDVGR